VGEAAVRRELVAANRILAHLGIVDGFGHVSVRDPAAPDRFLISCIKAPALVSESDILSLDFDGRTAAGERRRSYVERFIHAEIFRARDDVQAVVHSHSPAMIPFGVTSTALAPIYHMAACIGEVVPLFEIRNAAGDASDMLVRDSRLGAELARSLGPHSVVLMRGHGATAVGRTLREAVFTAVYAEMNARLQTTASQMGEIRFLSTGEIRAAGKIHPSQIDRAWSLWLKDAAPELIQPVTADPRRGA
jgi:HCOMODA/2-hydroxy-3-carboxy-muconic semialdehyde decarboxylase